MSRQQLDLVFLGDSLTEYFDWGKRFSRCRVTNLGIAGEPVEGLLARLNAIRPIVMKADITFIMTGINNIAMEEYEVARNYRKILKEISSWCGKAMVVVQSILPVLLAWVDNTRIAGINASLMQAAKESGAEYLDLYTSFMSRDGRALREYLLEDGVHLSQKGYHLWSDKVSEFIDATKPENRT